MDSNLNRKQVILGSAKCQPSAHLVTSDQLTYFVLVPGHFMFIQKRRKTQTDLATFPRRIQYLSWKVQKDLTSPGHVAVGRMHLSSYMLRSTSFTLLYKAEDKSVVSLFSAYHLSAIIHLCYMVLPCKKFCHIRLQSQHLKHPMVHDIVYIC